MYFFKDQHVRKMPKRKTDLHCFAPGRYSGYSGARKTSLFATARYEELQKKWEPHFCRQGYHLKELSAVCELLFKKHFIWSDILGVVKAISSSANFDEVSILLWQR